MKVTAFIRKTAAKNNITDQARVYFRVRDIGGVDIKAASELSINPNHWSPERQGYKPRVALVSEEKKMNFDKDVQQITHLITKEYHRGVDGSWLKSLIEEYHHPGINARGGNKADEYLLSYQIRKYVEETPLADESRKHHLDNLNKVLRYERFRHEVLHQRGFHLCIDTVTADDIRDFKLWMQEEHKYVDMYPVFYRNEVRRNVEQKRSENSMSGSLYRIRTVIKWCVKRGLTRNNPFDQYQIARPMYGDPFYLTLEERDKVYYADLNWKELMKAVKNVKVNYTEISKFPAVKRDLALLLDKKVQFAEISKFPAVKRDLALLLDKKVQFAEIEKIAYETEKKLLKEVSLFDVYEGKNLEAGKKSYAVSFLLQDENQTLNDKMIDKIMSKLVRNLEDKLGAKLR